MSLDPRWRDVRSVLAVRLDNLGDVLMTTPALSAVRHALPGARLTLLGAPSARGLARHLPMVDDVLAYDAPWVKGPSHPPGHDRRFIDTLAQHGFDAAIVFTVCTQSALPAAMMCRLAGIPLRLAHSRENPYDLLTDHVPDREVVADGMRHEVTRQLALVAAIGCTAPSDRLSMALSEADDAGACAALRRAGVDPDRPFVLVHPGATAASRRWAPDRFGAVADGLADQAGVPVVFVGGPDEEGVVDAARQAMRRAAPSLAGALTLGELAAAIRRAAVLVCNNSGPAHIAAALGTPVAVLYAQTNPQHTPWRVRAEVLARDVACRNCLRSVCPEGHHACLSTIAPDEVLDAALRLLAERAVARAA